MSDSPATPAVGGDFATWRDFIGSVVAAYKSKGQKVDPRLKIYEEKDLTSQSGASGGFLIPTQRLTELLSIAHIALMYQGRREARLGSAWPHVLKSSPDRESPED